MQQGLTLCLTASELNRYTRSVWRGWLLEFDAAGQIRLVGSREIARCGSCSCSLARLPQTARALSSRTCADFALLVTIPSNVGGLLVYRTSSCTCLTGRRHGELMLPYVEIPNQQAARGTAGGPRGQSCTICDRPSRRSVTMLLICPARASPPESARNRRCSADPASPHRNEALYFVSNPCRITN